MQSGSGDESAATRLTVIEPSRGLSLNLSALWEYRELLFFFIWRDLKVRYKQTTLGVFWALLQPLATMAIFSVIFGRFAKIPSEGLPYPVFVFAGLLPWTYFAASLQLSSMSIVSNPNLITKVYFPRLIIPLASVSVPLVDFVIAFGALIVMMVAYGIIPSVALVVAPAFLLLALLVAFGVGLWLSALNVRFRDVPYTIPFLIQLWMFASPVIYPVSLVPERWQWLLSLNPMTGVIAGFRWALLGQGAPSVTVVAVSAAVGAVLTATGLAYFRRTERQFADVI